MSRPSSAQVPPWVTPSATPPASRRTPAMSTRAPDSAPPLKRQRLSSTPQQPPLDVRKAREESTLRMLDVWSHLAERYYRRIDEDDIVDLVTGQVVKDRGVLRSMPSKVEFGGIADSRDDVQSNAEEEYVGEDNDESDDELDTLTPRRRLQSRPPPSQEDESEEEENANVDVSVALANVFKPVGALDPNDSEDAEDLKEFMEAERRRKELYGSEDEDEADTPGPTQSEPEDVLDGDTVLQRTDPPREVIEIDSDSDDEISVWKDDAASAVYIVQKHEDSDDDTPLASDLRSSPPLRSSPTPLPRHRPRPPKAMLPPPVPPKKKPPKQLQTPPHSQSSSSVQPEDEFIPLALPSSHPPSPSSSHPRPNQTQHPLPSTPKSKTPKRQFLDLGSPMDQAPPQSPAPAVKTALPKRSTSQKPFSRAVKPPKTRSEATTPTPVPQTPTMDDHPQAKFQTKRSKPKVVITRKPQFRDSSPAKAPSNAPAEEAGTRRRKDSRSPEPSLPISDEDDDSDDLVLDTPSTPPPSAESRTKSSSPEFPSPTRYRGRNPKVKRRVIETPSDESRSQSPAPTKKRKRASSSGAENVPVASGSSTTLEDLRAFDKPKRRASSRRPDVSSSSSSSSEGGHPETKRNRRSGSRKVKSRRRSRSRSRRRQDSSDDSSEESDTPDHSRRRSRHHHDLPKPANYPYPLYPPPQIPIFNPANGQQQPPPPPPHPFGPLYDPRAQMFITQMVHQLSTLWPGSWPAHPQTPSGRSSSRRLSPTPSTPRHSEHPYPFSFDPSFSHGTLPPSSPEVASSPLPSSSPVKRAPSLVRRSRSRGRRVSFRLEEYRSDEDGGEDDRLQRKTRRTRRKGKEEETVPDSESESEKPRKGRGFDRAHTPAPRVGKRKEASGGDAESSSKGKKRG